MASWPSCRPFSRAAAALLQSREGAWDQIEIGNGVNHVTQGNAITKSVQPLACILSGVALWLDTGDDPASGCDLQLLAGLNSLEVGGKVLPQIGYGDADHARLTPLYKATVHIQADARQDDRLICSSKAAS
jgi:hypothetical protein